ncbi:MAG: Gldg family protein [Candidatus Brocadiia bacterium]
MTPDAPPPASRPTPRTVLLYPVIGLLAVGNVVFALLWVLAPLGGGREGDGAGRRIEARSGARALVVHEGVPTSEARTALHVRLEGEQFEELASRLAQAARSARGAAEAEAYFASEAGAEAAPAATIALPRPGGGTDTLEVYALDAARQLCYCRLAESGQALAIPAEQADKTAPGEAQEGPPAWQQIAATLSQLSGGRYRPAVPTYVPLDEAFAARLAALPAELRLTTIAADPAALFGHLASSRHIRRLMSVRQPDPATLTATIPLPEALPMARGLADAMARASGHVVARHLALPRDEEAVGAIADALHWPREDLQDCLVLQCRGRTRAIPALDLFERVDLSSLVGIDSRFAGERVAAAALDELLATRTALYFAQGHGERRTDDGGREGLAAAAQQLRARGFPIRTCTLEEGQPLPEGCRCLVLAGPRKPYPRAIEDALARFLEGGGRLAVLLDPPHSPPVLPTLLRHYGIAVDVSRKPFQYMPIELDRSLGFTQGWLRGRPGLPYPRGLAFSRSWARDLAILATADSLQLSSTEDAAAAAHCLARAASSRGSEAPACLLAAAYPQGDAQGPRLLVAGDVDAFANRTVAGWPPELFGMEEGRVPLPGNIQLLLDAMAWLAR